MEKPDIHISDYTYCLPDGRIAKYPLARRDASKLLVYRSGNVSDQVFSELPEFLPYPARMVFNDTKVIPARLFFRKDSGAVIEVFCLEPHFPSDYAVSFASTKTNVWKTIVGNAKKWKGGILNLIAPEGSEMAGMNLCAELVEKADNSFLIRFSWDGGIPFSQVMEMCGRIPIPPYLNRETESLDYERYQTLYAKYRGSVAAPTAGLHFTDEVLGKIDRKGIVRDEICLHVGAGTFLPVKSESISSHLMHSEPFSVSLEFIKGLSGLKDGEKIIAVGTTSVRTLESLYFLGVHLLENNEPDRDAVSFVSQWEPYGREYAYSLKQAASAIADYLERNGLERLTARTQIIIVPGYSFHVVDAMVTNFHQPRSTLLLLIAAFIGEDWKKVYDYALGHDFRFLSYGDSSLLFRS